MMALDPPGALLLGAASLLWIAASVYAAGWLKGQPDSFRFWGWWLLTLAGSIGVFVAADLVTFYLVFALVSLPAIFLVRFNETAQARRAAAIYAVFTVLGEAFLLLAFVLLAQDAPSLLIRDAVAALPGSPQCNLTVALLLAGFGIKIGLVPLHVWMPLAYTEAPIPAASVLSGAAVKAGVIGLIRFLPLHVAMPGWGTVLVTVGFVAAFWGVAVGVTQSSPKTVLAYSSISQMGLIAAVLGMGFSRGDPGIGLIVAFYAAHHVLVKGGLFLAVGLAPTTAAPRRFWTVLLPATLVGLSLAGLPLTGGALAKLAIKMPLGSGAAGTLGALSAAGTALLMLHFIGRLAATPSAAPAASSRMLWSWLAIALAAIVLPWLLLAPLGLGRASDSLASAALWAGLWPALLGGALALLLRRRVLPKWPAGDIVVAYERAAAGAPAIGAAVERLDAIVRQWPVAGVSLVGLVLLLTAAMLFR